MSSEEQKKTNEKDMEGAIEEQRKKAATTEESPSSEEEVVCNERISNLETQLTEMQARERDNLLRFKAEMENVRRRSEQNVERAHKFALEKFLSELLPAIDSLDRALEISDKTNPDTKAMVEGIELTLKSMLDVMHKFGVKTISDTNVPLDPNIHQAIAMIQSEEVAPGNVLTIMQKGYTLNGRTIRAAMVTVAKS